MLTSNLSASRSKRRWLRFGLRTLLVCVLLAGLIFGWLARELQRVRERVAVVAELDRVGVYVYQYEPTGLGYLLRRALPTAAETWVRTRFGSSLLSGPSAFSSLTLRRGDLSYVLERLGRLSTVRTIRFPAGLLSEEDVGRFRRAMPKAEVEVDTRIVVAPGA
jgi:hypothetical protein